MTLNDISLKHGTRKFRCRRVSDLQDFLVLGPTKMEKGQIIRFSTLNLDTEIYHELDAFNGCFALLSSSIELGFMSRLGEPQIIKGVKMNYKKN